MKAAKPKAKVKMVLTLPADVAEAIDEYATKHNFQKNQVVCLAMKALYASQLQSAIVNLSAA